jgi:hypothetical protein
LPDSLAGLFGRNQAAFIGGLRPLFENSTGRRADLHFRFIANKRVNALGLSHVFTVAQIGALCKWIVSARPLSVETASQWKRFVPERRAGKN